TTGQRAPRGRQPPARLPGRGIHGPVLLWRRRRADKCRLAGGARGRRRARAPVGHRAAPSRRGAAHRIARCGRSPVPYLRRSAGHYIPGAPRSPRVRALAAGSHRTIAARPHARPGVERTMTTRLSDADFEAAYDLLAAAIDRAGAEHEADF